MEDEIASSDSTSMEWRRIFSSTFYYKRKGYINKFRAAGWTSNKIYVSYVIIIF